MTYKLFDLFKPKPVPTPRKLSIRDWKEALKETKDALSNKNLPILAAGIAYFTTLAFFPMLAAAVALAAFIIEPQQLQSVVHDISAYLPKDIASLVGTQLTNLSKNEGGSLWIAIFAIAISIFSASSATQNLITATNTAYGVDETRGFIKLKLISFGLTLGTLLFGFVLIPVLIVTSDFLTQIGVPEAAAQSIIYLRWIVVLILITVALAVFYRYGPDRKNPKWQWVSWGATAATIIWLIGTALFFFYAQNFAKFSESFGVFAGIIVLMTWFNLSSLIFLVGAEVNHRLESKA
jgi:membrane protein